MPAFKDDNTSGPDNNHFSIIGNEADLPAWTEIEEGRFMPRRVRGSFHGRALG
jgi:S-adenosylmethionine hydrolase